MSELLNTDFFDGVLVESCCKEEGSNKGRKGVRRRMGMFALPRLLGPACV